MSDATKKVLSITDLINDTGIEYDEVPVKAGIVRLGTVSSFDLLEWMDDNANPERSKLAGLRLLVKSIINEDGSRVGDTAADDAARKVVQDTVVKAMSRRDARENGLLVRRALQLNGLRAKDKADEIDKALKNDSSETVSDVSRSVSPSQLGDSTQTTSPVN